MTLVSVVFVLAFVGLAPALIARRKGRSFWIWWAFGAALPPVALVAAWRLATDADGIAGAGQLFRCPDCFEPVSSGATGCRYCGAVLGGASVFATVSPDPDKSPSGTDASWDDAFASIVRQTEAPPEARPSASSETVPPGAAGGAAMPEPRFTGRLPVIATAAAVGVSFLFVLTLIGTGGGDEVIFGPAAQQQPDATGNRVAAAAGEGQTGDGGQVLACPVIPRTYAAAAIPKTTVDVPPLPAPSPQLPPAHAVRDGFAVVIDFATPEDGDGLLPFEGFSSIGVPSLSGNESSARPAGRTATGPVASDRRDPPVPRRRPAPPPAEAQAQLDVSAVGEMVRWVQIQLRARGYYTQGVDGRAGPATRAAIRSYQRARNMAPTGDVSHDLVESLRSSRG